MTVRESALLIYDGKEAVNLWAKSLQGKDMFRSGKFLRLDI